MVSLLLAAGSVSLLLVGLGLLRASEARRAWLGSRAFRLRFARDTDPAAVTRFVAGLAGVRSPWSWHWLRLPVVALEIEARDGVIEHRLVVPPKVTGVVMSHLRAALPDVRIEQLPGVPELQITNAAELVLNTISRPLRTDRAEAASAAVLASLQPLRPGESVVVQWLLAPAPVPKPVRLAAKGDRDRDITGTLSPDSYDLLPHAEALKAERAKQAEPRFWCTARLGVRGARPARAAYLRSRVLGALQLLNAPGVYLRRRVLVTNGRSVTRLNRRSAPAFAWPLLLNAAELTGALGVPIAAGHLPGLSLGSCRQLPPPVAVPSEGCVIGRSTYPGSQRPVAIAPSDRLIHMAVTGPTGGGKSTLLVNLIAQDMAAGRGVIVIDPKRDLIADCLARVPASRVRDVVLLDPNDVKRPVGLNLLATDHGSAELVAEQVVHVHRQMFSNFWGPRTEDCFRAALLTLMKQPGMTLAEVPLLLTNEAWRRPFVAAVADDTVGLGAFWSWYNGLKTSDRSQAIAPLLNKLRATLLRRRAVYAVAQADGALRLEDVLAEGKVLFIPLSKGLLGDEAAALLGSLLIGRLWQATQARAGMPAERRRPVHLYVDEAQDFMNLPTSLGDMLAQARGLGLGVTLATQSLIKLPIELRRDMLANCRSKVIFQCSADDAHIYERELKPHLLAEDLQGLETHEVVAQLAANGRTAAPLTAVTPPPPEKTGQAAAARAWSRQHYGKPGSEIEAALKARHAVSAPDVPVGRRRKAS